MMVMGLSLAAVAIAGQPAGSQAVLGTNALDYVPGEVLVRFSPEVDAAQMASFEADQALSTLECISTLQLCRMKITDGSSLADAVMRAAGDTRVVYSEPNYIDHTDEMSRGQSLTLDAPLLEPNDTLYAQQWHYHLINLPEAWNRTTGNSAFVTAVVDTGARFDHPDLAGRLSANGYDFIGLDTDPTDPDNGHGSHTAGTIGAATNNSLGVAGVSWRGQILPIRTIGTGGGTHFQFSQGFHYAAGLLVAPDPVNPTPAKLINYSGGGGNSTTKRTAVADVNNAKVVMVASAGNDNRSFADAAYTSGYPARYSPDFPYVVAVGATDYGNGTPSRAPYSNYGPGINVVAPGGNTLVDSDGDGHVDGVLSTTWNFVSNTPVYEYWQGTSMAAPHVTGLASLLLGGGCPTSRIRSLLQSTATDIGAPGVDDVYGYGLINAKAALDAANPDLYVYSLKGYGKRSYTALQTGNVLFKWSVKNKGCFRSRSTGIKFWLSKDKKYQPGDLYLGKKSVPPLDGDAATTVQKTTFALRKKVDPESRWYIIGQVDAGKLVSETNEKNNMKVVQLTDK
jgi:hypothetical protein